MTRLWPSLSLSVGRGVRLGRPLLVTTSSLLESRVPDLWAGVVCGVREVEFLWKKWTKMLKIINSIIKRGFSLTAFKSTKFHFHHFKVMNPFIEIVFLSYLIDLFAGLSSPATASWLAFSISFRFGLIFGFSVSAFELVFVPELSCSVDFLWKEFSEIQLSLWKLPKNIGHCSEVKDVMTVHQLNLKWWPV